MHSFVVYSTAMLGMKMDLSETSDNWNEILNENSKVLQSSIMVEWIEPGNLVSKAKFSWFYLASVTKYRNINW